MPPDGYLLKCLLVQCVGGPRRLSIFYTRTKYLRLAVGASGSTTSDRTSPCCGPRTATAASSWRCSTRRASSERSGDAVGVGPGLLVGGVLRAGPEEAAQAVALRPGYDVGVQVRHGLRHHVV